jgi:hypothetical protein
VADTGGLDHHLGLLAAGGDRSRLPFTRFLLFSQEGARRQVTLAYAELLGRAPEPGGDAYWTAVLQGRAVTDLRVFLMASDEYAARAGGTDMAWIDALYRDGLGRASDPAGLQYWLGRRSAGASRILVAAGIALSDEALIGRVDRLHLDALGRQPSPPERAAGVAVVRAEGERVLASRLYASDEAFEPYLEAAWPHSEVVP